MEWFHFSDFHIGKPKGPQATAMDSLINAVKAAKGKVPGKVDAVFITGDIAFSGKENEYERFRDDFLTPLKKINGFEGTRIFAVPGNHDLDCEIGLPIAWNTIGQRNQVVFFSEDAAGIGIRKDRSASFKAYRQFVLDNSIISPDPFLQVSSIHQYDDMPFAILLTNTAFFSDKDRSSSEEDTPSPIESLRSLLKKNDCQKPLVILAHHPIPCFLREHQDPFSSFLKERKAVFLHGHEHKPVATFKRDGTIKTLGFGAAYVAHLQEKSAAPYLNTFTHCRLDSDLEINCYSWHPATGVWAESTAHQLPDCMPDESFSNGPGKVSFPSIVEPLPAEQESVPFSAVKRTAPRPARLIPIDDPSEELISKLVLVSKNMRYIYQKCDPTVRYSYDDDGKTRIELEHSDGGRHLLYFIGGINHVLSSKEIESVNTDIDTEGYASATIISLGKTSSEAHSMYIRLRERKPIEVLTNDGLLSEIDELITSDQSLLLRRLDAANNSLCLLVGKEDIYLLVIDEKQTGRSFYVVDGSGESLDPSGPIVARLRRCDPDFASMPYAGEAITATIERPAFLEIDYLTQCYHEYNVMKYAALANVGLRFSDLPLEDLYVNASASEISSNSTYRSEQFYDDHLSSYPVSNELKDLLQSHSSGQESQGERKETSRAREFCQKYSAVLVTGDPGSGKTCFVKNEILAYSKRGLPAEDRRGESVTDWHSHHVPVMVPLSAAAAEADLEEKGLFIIAARLLERRGLSFPPDEMQKLATQGRLALFFDGLDEVVSVEKRALVVKNINELIVRYIPAGNRVIVTSRPAAVQVVNLLPSLHKLELQGLTDGEIRTLASRLLTLRLAGSNGGVNVDKVDPSETDNILIVKLLEDCKSNPGVARMAQNPLLLTLLIMIYANSGAPSAKRHRIYEEAIKTLASVRGREAGHQPISVQDLRERLGAIALSVYRKESGILPTRSEVCDVVRTVMERQLRECVSPVDANAFIQKVAESTGLIVLESKKGEDDNRAIVTFMHHSFLEYFAAVGLSRDLENTNIGTLVREPRWHEILTLLSGIIGEGEDVAPIISKFLDSTSPELDVNAKLLLFAMDCALECEVPSEAAQRLLSGKIKTCLSTGPGRLDKWVRSEIGKRLGYLIDVCGGAQFDNIISELIRDRDETISAAGIDLAGHVCSNDYDSITILSSFEEACTRTEDPVLSAICSSVSRSRSLRSHASLQVVSMCLRKSQRSQQAAYEAISNIPSLAVNHWSEIINGIDSRNPRTSLMASIAAMQAGLNVDLVSLNASRKDLLLRALNQVDSIGGHDDYLHAKVKKDTLRSLMSSSHLRDRKLGIRLLPLAEDDESYAYEQLMSLLKPETPREELVSALIALKWSGSVLSLFKLSDLRTVAYWLKNGTNDVRNASAQLLGWANKDTIAVEALLDQNYSAMDKDEYCNSIQAIANTKVLKERVREFLFAELSGYLDEKTRMNEDNIQRTKSLLDAVRTLGETAPVLLANRIKQLIEDYKTDETLKRRALLCFPSIALPSHKTVEIITEYFTRPLSGIEVELVQLPTIFTKKCRTNIDYVTACVGALPELRVALISYHEKLLKRAASYDNEFCVTELRSGIDDVTQIIVAFHDFIDSGQSLHTIQ